MYLQTLECQLSKLNLVIQVSCCDRGAEIWLERSRKWFRCVDLLMTCCASDVGRLHEFLCAVFCIGGVLHWRFVGLIACISGKLVQVRMSWFILNRRFKHSHSTRKHKLGKYGIMRGWVISIDVIIHHFTRNRNQRSTSEKNLINVYILSLTIPAKAESSKNQLEIFKSSLFVTWQHQIQSSEAMAITWSRISLKGVKWYLWIHGKCVWEKYFSSHGHWAMHPSYPHNTMLPGGK